MQILIGKVIANSSNQTVSVSVGYSQKHPKYQKILKRETKYLVHNEIEGIKAGDMVKFAKTKPISKRKHFKVLEKINN
jgi:small subunit ribosomal protein S17